MNIQLMGRNDALKNIKGIIVSIASMSMNMIIITNRGSKRSAIG